MVVRQRDVHHRPDLDLAVDRDRTVLRLVQPENADLRIVDDRRRDERAEHAAVRDRERAAGEVVHRQLAVARALGDRRDVARDLEHALAVGVLDVRHDEPGVGRDGDAHVHIMLVDDRVAVDLRVDRRDTP